MSKCTANLGWFFLSLIVLFGIHVFNPCLAETEEIFLIKEVVEITTDVTDIYWSGGVEIVSASYEIVEGKEAITSKHVSGLDVHIGKEGFDDAKVVVEIEALVKLSNATSTIIVEKGDIEATNIYLYAYEPGAEYSHLTTLRADSPSTEVFDIDLVEYIHFEPIKVALRESLQDLRRKVFAFYYPWYGNPKGPSGRAFHWSRTSNTIRNSANQPLLGPYDSFDEGVIRTHILMAKQAGIDGFIVSWWGPGTFEDEALGIILGVAEEEEFSISIYYETVRYFPGPEKMISELDYLVSKYCIHPSFLKEDDEPVIFVYIPEYDDRDTEWWLAVRNAVERDNGPITLIGDHDEPDLSNAFEAFHTYNYLGDDFTPYYSDVQERVSLGITGINATEYIALMKTEENITLDKKMFFVTASPGFDTTDWESPGMFIDREEGDRYGMNWDAAVSLEAHTVLLTSYNEWHEGTELEPSVEHGFDYLNITRRYVEEYKGIDIETPSCDVEMLVNPFHYTPSGDGNGSISVVMNSETPLVMVDVTVDVVDGVSGLSVEGGPIAYCDEEDRHHHRLVYPIIQGNTNFTVTFSPVGEAPEFSISASGYDPSGRRYELLDDYVVSATMLEPFAEPGAQEPSQGEPDEEPNNGIPGFTFMSMLLGFLISIITVISIKSPVLGNNEVRIKSSM